MKHSKLTAGKKVQVTPESATGPSVLWIQKDDFCRISVFLFWIMKPLFDLLRNIFKMPVIWWPWMAGLPLINLSSVFFLPRTEAWVVLGTGLLAATIMTFVHARFGYVRLVGIGHFVWIPMLIWLVFRLEKIPEGTLFYTWLQALMLMDAVSLLIDIIDLVRYVRGDRSPRF